MRVLMIDPLFSTPPYDELLCAALARAGHDVVFAARRLGPGESWRVPNVPLIELNLVNVLKPAPPSRLPKQLVTLARHLNYGLRLQRLASLVRAIKPDVIHIQWCLTPLAERLLLRLLPRGIPVIYTMHDTNPFNGGQVSSLLKFGLDALLTKFDSIIVHTDSAVIALSDKGLRKKKLRRVAHGPLHVTRDRASAAPSGPAADTRVQFLLFGIMKPYKGIDSLIEAVARMPENVRQRCSVRIVGMPDMDLNRLVQLMEHHRLGDTIWLDPRFVPDDEIHALFSEADVNIFPYHEIEASGVFTIAIQFAKPIIASNIGLFKETLIHNENGLLVPPGDSEALAEAITSLTLSADQRARLGAGMAIAFSRYPTWDAVAQATTMVYEQCLSTKGARAEYEVPTSDVE